MTEVIPNKFCSVIKTTKYSLWVVPKVAPQIQNGRWPPSWKSKKLQYLQNCLSNFDKILHSDTYWSYRAHKLSNYSNFQKSKMAGDRHLKSAKRDISATVWLILMKFGSVVHIIYSLQYCQWKIWKSKTAFNQIWWWTDLNVTTHLFCDYNWLILLIFAILKLWLSLLHLVVNWQVFTSNTFIKPVKLQSLESH